MYVFLVLCMCLVWVLPIELARLVFVIGVVVMSCGFWSNIAAAISIKRRKKSS